MGVCEVPVVDGLCNAAAEASTNWLITGFEGAAEVAGHTAAFLFESMWSIFEATTFVDLTSGRFTSVYNLLFGIAVFVMLAFFLLQVTAAMIRREGAALTRAVLGLAKSVLGSFIALTLIAAALEITDQLTLGIVSAAGTTMEDLGARIALLSGGIALTMPLAPGVGALLSLFVASLAIGGAFIIWISLLIRKALLLVAIVFAPVAMAGLSWDATRGWVSRWATFVIALIVSKLVIVVFFLLAVAEQSAPISSDLQSLSDPISGVVLMLIAGFAPYLTYKAISFIGVDFYHAASSEQEAKHALDRPLPTPSRPARPTPTQVLDGGHGARPPTTPATSAARPAGPAAPAGTSAGAAGGAASGGAAAGAAGGAVAAAGVGVVAVGAAAAGRTWAAGQRTGRTVAGAAGSHHDGAATTGRGDRR
ncbi:conjugal transfer protein TrbL [Pengzhenrongella sicca]|uniref:Conjugal transfer protein TrbL n=1 Tax=Pengzhenrongella sicca TaxID=2819238 RepID=A0A8A4ZC76_9MICO|nr:conjugal transfer protein TrbL [Pengzhenrongella sicca]QTE28619.1 conjugal transfer protein TrbL [Pengzhenrongella sicca]